LLLAGFSIWRFRNSKKREHEIDIKYQELLQRFNDSKKYDAFEGTSNIPSYGRSTYNQEIIDEVKSHLELFENKKFFLKKNLTLPIVAKMIGSHRTQLSYVLNEHYQMTFNRYLKVLRIQYITNLLLENSKYLNYSIDSLAEECGMTSRQVFSIHFMEINGMRPVDFIRKRKEELEKS
jgi:AraC-like DNA-binding protein